MGAPATGSVNLVGISPAFRQGYFEGCNSAGALHARRDEFRYRRDPEYMNGWNDGYSICSREH